MRHDNKPLLPLVCSLLLLSLGASGCAKVAARKELPPAPPPPGILVGGLVRSPGYVEMRDRYLSIADAIILAGGPTVDVEPSASASPNGSAIPLVAISRGKGPSVTTFIPLAECTTGHFSEIPLFSGDRVSVVLSNHTSISQAQLDQNGNRNYQLKGLVEKAGLRVASDQQSLKAIQLTQSARTQSSSSAMVVERMTGHGKERFLIPLSSQNDLLLGNPVSNSDSIEFTRAEIIPDVIMGAVAPSIPKVVAKKCRESVDAIDELGAVDVDQPSATYAHLLDPLNLSSWMKGLFGSN